MDIKDILSVGLTAEDFDTLIKGKDAIPEKERAEVMLKGTLHLVMSSAMSPHHKSEADAHFERRMKDVDNKCAADKDDQVILKSKLILLKRLLLSNEAVKMANEILQNTPPIKTHDYQLVV